jgi:hypothetical protein
MIPLALIPDFINGHLGWWLFGIIVAAGLVLGMGDIARWDFKRIWAISGVCFAESIRRRVLLITPLAILGIVIVSQLQRPLDEQDAIRQTIKISLFATGLLVALTTIILACTNLPREIENRVIYTIVTKPTTRLEIVLGKVIGFAKVSLAILVIMGLFSYGYLKLRSWNMQRSIGARLEAKEVPAVSLATMEYYRDSGLLNAKTLRDPSEMQIYAHVPQAGETRRYMFGSMEGSFLAPFDLTPAMMTPAGGKDPGEFGALVVVHVGYIKHGASTQPAAVKKPVAATGATTGATTGARSGPTTVPYYGPFIMSPEQRAAIMGGTKSAGIPTVSLEVMDSNQNSLSAVSPQPPMKTFELTEPGVINEIRGFVEPKYATKMTGRIYIRVTANTPGLEYFIDASVAPPVSLGLVEQVNNQVSVREIPGAKDALHPDAAAEPIFQTKMGTFGQQVRGGEDLAPTAIYQFRNANLQSRENNEAPFELRASVERSGADESAAAAAVSDQPTRVGVRIKNLASGQLSAETIVQPESYRTTLFTMPAAALEGGNFDVQVRCLTPGDFLGLQDKSLTLITDRQPFAWNLAKSLLILWLMTILITSIAIFASTFLSWPIAVVLTLVILLGHWGVEQLGDATAPGVGSQAVTDFGVKNPAKAEALRATVERLSSFLNFISTIMPDISKFPAVEDIERGIAIPGLKLEEAAGVALGFGLPLVLLSYLILKNKEVAP